MSAPTTSPSQQKAEVVARILEVHKTLVGLAHDLRRMDDFDHAQHMSSAALRRAVPIPAVHQEET